MIRIISTASLKVKGGFTANLSLDRAGQNVEAITLNVQSIHTYTHS